LGNLGMYYHTYALSQAAETCYRRAAKLDPKKFEWAYYLGRVQAQLGQAAAALETLARARALRPEYVPLLVETAILHAKGGNFDAAVAMLAEALERDPKAYRAMTELGSILAKRGELERGLEHLRKSIEIAPQFGPSHFAMAEALRMQGRSEEAQASLERWRQSPEVFLDDPVIVAVERLNYSSKSRLKLARQLAGLGRVQESIDVLLDLVRHYPDNGEAHARLVQLYARTGNKPEAEKHWNEQQRILAVLKATTQKSDK